MKAILYAGPGDIFDARNLPGFSDDDKWTFYSAEARYDADGQPLDATRRGTVIEVTDKQAEELMTYGHQGILARFVEVASKTAGKAPRAEGGS